MVGVSSSIILLSFFLMFTYLFVMWNGEIYGSQDDICCCIFILSEYGENGATFLHKLFTVRMLNVIRRFLLEVRNVRRSTQSAR